MARVETQRTLVKSPPELWAEVSDAVTLARHLGEFGEIRITRAEPETIVAWEGARASGTIELAASGWGTRVTLTAAQASPPKIDTPDLAPTVPAPGSAQPLSSAEPGPPPDQTPPTTLADKAADRDVPVTGDDVPMADPEGPVAKPVVVEAASEPAQPSPATASARASSTPQALARPAESRRGFFARLFRRRDRPAASPPTSRPADQVAPAPAVPEPPSPAPVGSAACKQVPEFGSPPRQVDTAAAEVGAIAARPVDEAQLVPAPFTAAAPTAPVQALPQAEVRSEERTTEVAASSFDDEWTLAALRSALDSLGSAHHRPFSRG